MNLSGNSHGFDKLWSYQRCRLIRSGVDVEHCNVIRRRSRRVKGEELTNYLQINVFNVEFARKMRLLLTLI
jgi:hypothetical protein